MQLSKFRQRVGPLRTLRLLNAAIDHVGPESEQGIVLAELKSTREGREAFQDQICSMMSETQLASAPKADGEFIKWLLNWLIENLPAIIALFTV